MIRLLLGVLIAVNIVLFLWLQYGSPRPESTPMEAKQGADFGGILLASEMQPPGQKPVEPQEMPSEVNTPGNKRAGIAEKRQETATQATGSRQKSVAEKRYCGELGPIRSRNMAEGYRRSLLKAGKGEAKVEPRSGKEDVGYWTMIPQMADTASAEAMLKKLQKAGLKDLWLMRKGEHKNAISLGLYTEKRYAQRHANNIRKKGFSPVVVPKQKKTRVYWVSFSGVDKAGLGRLQGANIPSNVSLSKKVCKQALTTN